MVGVGEGGEVAVAEEVVVDEDVGAEADEVALRLNGQEAC